MRVILLLLSWSCYVFAQSPEWGQCGGIGWNGPTNCVAGTCCTKLNDWYSQCIPGNCSPPSSSMPPTSSSSVPSSSTSQPPPTSTGLSPGCGKSPLSSGTFRTNVNGKSRQYRIQVPSNYDQNRGYKVIFGLHPLGSNMDWVVSQQYYGLQPLSNNTVIFISPDGLNQGWANEGGEDILLMDAILDNVMNNLCVNPNLVFSTGFSYGAAMSYSLACSRANRFRAVAGIAGGPVSGCQGGNDPAGYMGIHGVSDNVLPINLGRDLRDRFVRNNGCASMNPSEPSPGSGRYIKTEYSGCREGYPVVWIAFDGGHTPTANTGPGGSNIAPGETWDFFGRFT